MNISFKNLEECTGFFKKFRGLMFSKKRNLIFDLCKETRIGAMIHMFFVFYPIDVYWLNEKKEIVDERVNLKPFMIAIPKKKARYIIEISKKNFI
ncbi:DUF192 domain-containing protein [Candidatus Woesearchaeota archaeon]|nr:DUF192 domain-containing protein [Candidatus Woesearchaeota archaeon]